MTDVQREPHDATHAPAPRWSTAATATRTTCGDVPATVLVEPAADRPGRRHQPDGHGLVRLRTRLLRHRLGRPVFGSVIFFWCGWVFLSGAWTEIEQRQPGMMLLISMAICVAFAASVATSSDGSTSTSGGSSPRSSRSCCSATGWRCGPSARRRARSPRSPSCCPTKPSASTPTAASRRSRSTSCGSATSCSCDRARASPPTA